VNAQGAAARLAVCYMMETRLGQRQLDSHNCFAARSATGILPDQGMGIPFVNTVSLPREAAGCLAYVAPKGGSVLYRLVDRRRRVAACQSKRYHETCVE
jgi:hypothetical protein